MFIWPIAHVFRFFSCPERDVVAITALVLDVLGRVDQ